MNLRTAKIQLLQLIDDRTPVDQFGVTGPFDFSDNLKPLETYRDAALAARSDLQAALQTVQQSETNHKLAIANGSTDPTFGTWYTYNPSTNNPNGNQTLDVSLSIPLRIFDRNQGEKKRTRIDIDRSQQASEAMRAQVFSDVDTSYELVRSNIALLKSHKEKYNDQALSVRDTATFAYEHGGASLTDGLSQCAKRLSAGAVRLRTASRRLSDSRRPTRPCCRRRNNPIECGPAFYGFACIAPWENRMITEPRQPD